MVLLDHTEPPVTGSWPRWAETPTTELPVTLPDLLLDALICQSNPDLYVSWLRSEVELKAVLAFFATLIANGLSLWPPPLLLLLVNELSCPAIRLSHCRCVLIVLTSVAPPDHVALVQQHYANLRIRSTAGFIQICRWIWSCCVQGKCQNIPFWPLTSESPVGAAAEKNHHCFYILNDYILFSMCVT